MISKSINNGIEILTLENNHMSVSVAPALGGKFTSVYNKVLGKEFLWMNERLPMEKQEAGADYDSNFLGGIDELIPNDIPETIDLISYPDHGELWTTALEYKLQDEQLSLSGKLMLSGLLYSKTVSLDPETSSVNVRYSIRNATAVRRHFLWKLHAALVIHPGDKLVTPAKRAQVVDPAYSRFKNELNAFTWPVIENTDASQVPEKNDTVDFFYLYDIPQGEMQLSSENNEHLFTYSYETGVFPFQWWFASYGGFLGHYTAILEPCTNMPISVTEAIKENQCAVLDPGESLNTIVRIFAGEKKNYIS